MASTNKTTNYELSQFEGTDKPSWEADYNADMLSIDTNLKAVSDVADGASGSISTLADRVTTAEGNITTNANDIDALEARADALEAGETAADGRLDAIEAEQIVQNTAIESNTRLGYNLARPYDSASTYSVGSYVLFQDTLYKCTTAVTTGESFDPTKWFAIKATDEIAAGGYTLPTASANVLGGVKVGSGLAIDGSGVLSASGGASLIYDGDITSQFTFGNPTAASSCTVNRITSYSLNNACFVTFDLTFLAVTSTFANSTTIVLPITSSPFTISSNTFAIAKDCTIIDKIRDLSLAYIEGSSQNLRFNLTLNNTSASENIGNVQILATLVLYT